MTRLVALEETATAAGSLQEPDSVAMLLRREFKPQTERACEEVEAAVFTLAREALAGSAALSNDAVESIEAIIAEIDRKLSAQINLILHAPEFQKLEAAWRGLHYLVNNTETDTQ